MINYKKCLVEVDEILKHLSEEDYKKIPINLLNIIKENKDKTYVWEYDETKSLREQMLSRDTVVILSFINLEYLLTDEQKLLMEQIYKLNNTKLEKEQLKFSGIDIFNNKDEIHSKNNLENSNKNIADIRPYNDNIFKRIFKKIIKKR